MISIRAGELRHRLTHQTYTDSVDSVGQPTKSWSNQSTYWAKVSPLSARERADNQTIEADVSHRVVMRYSGTTISPDDRLIFGSRTLHIEQVLNVDERNHRLELLCKEEV